MPLQLLDRLAVAHADDADRSILTGNRELASVNPKRDGRNGGRQRFDLLDFLAIACAVDPNDLVGECHGRLRPIAPKRGRNNRLVRDGDLFKACIAAIPNAQNLVAAGRGHLAPILTDREYANWGLGVETPRFAGGKLPEPRQTIRARRDESLIIGEIREGAGTADDGLWMESVRLEAGFPKSDRVSLIARSNLGAVAAPGPGSRLSWRAQ